MVALLLFTSGPAAVSAPLFQAAPAARLPAPRSGMAVVAARGRIYCIGGRDEETACADAWCYDPVTRRWTDLPPLPEPRFGHAAVVMGHRILVLGGRREGMRWMHGIEALDLDTGRWSLAGQMPFARSDFAAVAAHGRVLVIGGMTDTEGATASVEVLDPDTMEWSRGVPLPEGRRGLAAAVVGDNVVTVGGQSANGVCRADTLFFRSGGCAWEVAAPLAVARSGLALARLGARLVALGGWSMVGAQKVLPRAVEMYDAAGGRWLTVGAMAGREGCGAAALHGRVYLAGGWDGHPVAEVEDVGWVSSASGWAPNWRLGFQLAYLPETPVPEGVATVPVRAVGFAPAAAADITNIPLDAALRLGLPLPGRPHPERYHVDLKFYQYPPFLDAARSTRRVLEPLLLFRTGAGRFLDGFVRAAGHVWVKDAAIRRVDWPFGPQHPFPPLRLPTEPIYRNGGRVDPQAYFDQGVPFASLYVAPTPPPPADLPPDEAARRSADGVLACYDELLALYRQSFVEVNPGQGHTFLDDTDPDVLRVIVLPPRPRVFRNYRSLTMPQDPQHLFLSGLFVIREDDFRVGTNGVRAERLRSRALEIGSVVWIRAPAPSARTPADAPPRSAAAEPVR